MECDGMLWNADGMSMECDGRGRYDALGSIAIGASLGGVSLVLISKNRRLLLGQARDTSQMTPDDP